MPKKDGSSRVFTVRLDPETSFGIHFFSNQLKYRTGSKFIEEAIGLKLKQTTIEYVGSDGETVSTDAISVLNAIWHPDPVTRFLNIAFDYPELLRNDEILARIWAALSEMEILWIGGEFRKRADKSEVYVYETKRENLDLKTFRKHWYDFEAWADDDTPIEKQISRDELEALVNKSVKQAA